MTDASPPAAPIPGAALAELFVRTYRRVAPNHDFDPGPDFPDMAAGQRALLTEVFADLELALRPPRAITELRDGDTIILITPEANSKEVVEHLQQTVQSWMPDREVYVAGGISHVLVDGVAHQA